jgi:SM-20-related protein
MLASLDDQFEIISSALSDQGWVVLPNALPNSVLANLQGTFASTKDFHTAGIGRGNQHNLNLDIRRDHIHWLEDDQGLFLWRTWVKQLQQYLNRTLYLGLTSFESHFALYQPGDFYKTHLDAFRGQSNRRLSLVTYLNVDWQSADGGELVIYQTQNQQEIVRVLPQLGTLVLFLSEDFPHEVLPTHRLRRSVAGWFRAG